MKRLSTNSFSFVISYVGIIIFILFSTIQLNAQTIQVDDSVPIKELMYTPVQKSIQIQVQNISETDILKYQSTIEYERSKRTPQDMVIQQDSLVMKEVGDSLYNTFLQYVDTAYLSSAYGNSDLSPVTVATRFTAGEEGFNLSDVGTWFISENDTLGTVQVEIRAGGNSIDNATVVYQGSAKFENKQSEINGHMYNINLEKEVSMYPREDFYVIFTYPVGIARPQGCAVHDSIAVVNGRYWAKINNTFVDLQQTEGYKNGAWLMYAAEKSPQNIGWLNITRNASASIVSESSLFIYLQLDGKVAGLGSQYADVVIQSNDTLNPEKRISVELRLNEAPYFMDAPSDIFVNENVSSEINISVRDLEENEFSVAPVMGCKFVQFSYNDSIQNLNLNISPKKGDAGDYTIQFVATDEYGMSRNLKITIHVLPNQPPAFIEPPAEISVEETKDLDVQITASDPENEDFVISLTGNYAFITSSFEYPAITLHISPQIGDAGDYTLRLTAQDTTGSGSELLIPLHVLVKNRPPMYIGDDNPITFSFMDNTKNFNITDYFMDLDNDSFTFDIVCQNPNIVEVTTDNKTYFTLKPKAVGNTTLDFTLVDARGEQSQYTIEVIVGLCDNPNGIIVQKWNKTLLVNNYSGEYASGGYQWYRNGIPIRNATRQDYCSEDDTGGLLDFTAEYFVRIIKTNGDTIYTCPYTPVQKATAVKIYPNPVAGGEPLHIETESTSAGSDAGTIQIMDILGNIQKTISMDRNILMVPMPDAPGIYIVKIVYGDSKKAFRIKVY